MTSVRRAMTATACGRPAPTVAHDGLLLLFPHDVTSSQAAVTSSTGRDSPPAVATSSTGCGISPSCGDLHQVWLPFTQSRGGTWLDSTVGAEWRGGKELR